ncbi:hypothetical protein BJ741DRAFT_672145 [Chytriomyces cf. hyalinus JEL632]|nr:hypothetical protein BJ741DRAFT_672145 [Chytriomyces cf. hyalinus JEL632]
MPIVDPATPHKFSIPSNIDQQAGFGEMQTFDGMARMGSSSGSSITASFPATTSSWLDGLATAFDSAPIISDPIKSPPSTAASAAMTAPPRRSSLPTQPRQLRNLKDLPLERLPTLRRTFSFKKLRFTAEAGPFEDAEMDAEHVPESLPESVEEMLQDCEARIPSYTPEQVLPVAVDADAVGIVKRDEPKKGESTSVQALNDAFLAFLHSDAMKRDLQRACSNSNSIYYTAEQTRQTQYQLSIGKLKNSKRPLHQQVLIVGVLAKLHDCEL